MISAIISRLIILIFGTLYPAYASYKAVNTKNVKEYVKWMMYWIVFALFTCTETFTDVFLSWFPFYYEIKVVIVIWFLSPATKGSSILYRKFVHPMLHSREQEIDEYIAKAKEQSYKQVLDLGSKGMSALMQTALKSGGGIVNQLRKSYSLSDISEQPLDTFQEQDVTDAVIIRKKRLPIGASASSSLYFSEVDVRRDMVAHIHSIEDISSGYSSGEPLFNKHERESLIRPGPLRSRSVRVTRSTMVPKKTDDDNRIIYFINKLPVTNSTDSKKDTDLSSGDEFFDTINVENVLLQKQKSCAHKPGKTKNFEKKYVCQKMAQPIIKSNSIESLNFSTSELRAGRYNKKVAPLPPNAGLDDNDSSKNAAIKARLVLKPGTVKPNDPHISQKSEQFLRSPNKLKSRSLSKSPVRNKQKHESSLLRLMMIPRKLNFWHKDDEIKPEKKCYTTHNTCDRLLVDTKPISKSAENFPFEYSPAFSQMQ